MEGVEVEATDEHRSAVNPTGVEELTPARVLIAEMIRRYWVLGIDCTRLEVHKLGWFIERSIGTLGTQNLLELDFKVDKYGPHL